MSRVERLFSVHEQLTQSVTARNQSPQAVSIIDFHAIKIQLNSLHDKYFGCFSSFSVFVSFEKCDTRIRTTKEDETWDTHAHVVRIEYSFSWGIYRSFFHGSVFLLLPRPQLFIIGNIVECAALQALSKKQERNYTLIRIFQGGYVLAMPAWHCLWIC